LLDTVLDSIFVPDTSLAGDEDFEVMKCSYCCSVTAFPKDFSETVLVCMTDKMTNFMEKVQATDGSKN